MAKRGVSVTRTPSVGGRRRKGRLSVRAGSLARGKGGGGRKGRAGARIF